MIPNDRSFTFDRVVQLALFAGLAWGLVLLLDYLSDVLLPFFAGLVVAYFLDPGHQSSSACHQAASSSRALYAGLHYTGCLSRCLVHGPNGRQ